MGSEELIANLFRISQTEQRLRNENITLKKNRIKRIMKLVKKLEIQLRNLEELCLKIYLNLKKV